MTRPRAGGAWLDPAARAAELRKQLEHHGYR